MDLSVNTSSTYAAGSSKSALKSFAKKTDNTSNTTKAADTAAVYEKTTTEKKDSANEPFRLDFRYTASIFSSYTPCTHCKNVIV